MKFCKKKLSAYSRTAKQQIILTKKRFKYKRSDYNLTAFFKESKLVFMFN